MRILYVILTCEQYKNTRQQWQKDSWLNGVKYVYLDDSYGKEGYLNVATKYVDFFNRTDISQYDWLFFCDDDTFVFTKWLSMLLIQFNSNKPYCIGFKIGTFKIEGTELYTTCFSGGAGIAMSNEIATNIQNYVLAGNPILTNESDTSLAVWCKRSTPDFIAIDKNEMFRPTGPRHPSNEGFTNCITYHYCNQKDFNILKAQIMTKVNVDSWSKEANAKLIAAAPDLLEALIEIENYFDKMRMPGRFAKRLSELTKAAIKKATE